MRRHCKLQVAKQPLTGFPSQPRLGNVRRSRATIGSSAFYELKATVGTDPLFSSVKADRRARIQETASSADAMLPEGPYDLWRADEPSRRVKDLVGGFGNGYCRDRRPKRSQVSRGRGDRRTSHLRHSATTHQRNRASARWLPVRP